MNSRFWCAGLRWIVPTVNDRVGAPSSVTVHWMGELARSVDMGEASRFCEHGGS